MSYTRIQINDDKTYSVFWSDAFYPLFHPYYIRGSYFNVMYRLFGLLPRDFYHYIGATYNATFRKSPVLANYIYVRFNKQSDAERFAAEVNHRIEYCVKRGDFISHTT